jgi:hypothetical protein
MWCWYDFVADDFAETRRGLHASAYGDLNRGDVAAKADRDEATTDLLETQQIDKARFRRSVGRFDGSDEATGFNKPDCSLRHSQLEFYLARIVDSKRHQSQIAGALDSANDAGLLLARGASAAGGLYFTSRCDKLGENIDAFVVDFLGLELGYGLSAVAAKLGDDRTPCRRTRNGYLV